MKSKRIVRKQEKAFLVGPFIGELNWEMYRFAPYIIHLKKEFPEHKVVVFTRPYRFDFYGKYADILVPLNLVNDNIEKHNGFTMKDFTDENYKLLINSFTKIYNKRFKVTEHIYPKIDMFYAKIKWQFPKSMMDYDFKPRGSNYKYIKEMITDNMIFIDNNIYSMDEQDIDYNIITSNAVRLKYKKNKQTSNRSIIGCIIEIIKECKFIVTNVNTVFGRLALLLKIPIITINEELTEDEINLLNPLNTDIIMTNDIRIGIAYYENNIRS